MTETDSAEFDRLCSGELRAALDGAEAVRSRAVGRFWLFLGLTLVIAVVAAIAAGAAFELPGAIVALVVVGIIGLLVALHPVTTGRRAIKGPIAEAVAGQLGFSWTQGAGPPAGLSQAERTLFGGVTSRTYGDLFTGEVDGRPASIGEVTLTRQSGKSTVTVFSGHVWRLAAGQPYASVSVAVPDKGFFNFMAPSHLQRVKMADDPAFDRVFELYGEDADLTRAFFGPELRAELVAVQADAGRAWVYLGGDDVLVAVSGSDRFEPGSMFKRMEGVERARGVWNELNGAVGFARRLSTAFPTR